MAAELSWFCFDALALALSATASCIALTPVGPVANCVDWTGLLVAKLLLHRTGRFFACQGVAAELSLFYDSILFVLNTAGAWCSAFIPVGPIATAVNRAWIGSALFGFDASGTYKWEMPTISMC